MAKIKDLDDVESQKKKNNFIAGADMKKMTATAEKKKTAGGRPKKATADKSTEHIFINLTVAEKEAAEVKAAEFGISLSALAKIGLKKILDL